MNIITLNVQDPVYARYKSIAAKRGKKASELIREAMAFYLEEKLEKQQSLDSWEPLSLGSLISDYADGVNREEMCFPCNIILCNEVK